MKEKLRKFQETDLFTGIATLPFAGMLWTMDRSLGTVLALFAGALIINHFGEKYVYGKDR